MYSRLDFLEGGGVSPSKVRYLHTGQHKHRINADIHVSNGIRTHDSSVRTGEGSSCLRPRSYCDRREDNTKMNFKIFGVGWLRMVSSDELL
jgi:hypothetical protein